MNLLAFCLNAPLFVCDRNGQDNFWGGAAPWGGGNQNAPAVPPGMWPQPQRQPSQLTVDGAKLEQQLKDLCPDQTVTTSWGTKCCPSDCSLEAKRIAHAIKTRVEKESENILAGGWFGNFLAFLSGERIGHGCVKWQKIVLEAYQEGITVVSPKPKCFIGAGVAVFWPFTSWTRHNWVEIFGPDTRFSPWKDFVTAPGVHIDPWPSGGHSLFPETLLLPDDIVNLDFISL